MTPIVLNTASMVACQKVRKTGVVQHHKVEQPEAEVLTNSLDRKEL